MYSGVRRGKAFGYYCATVGLSTAVGPLLGGLILKAFGAAEGWRFIFYLSVPVVLGALAIGHRVLPADQKNRVHHRLDLVGALLLGLGVLAVMLPHGAVTAFLFYAGFTSIFLVITLFLQLGLKYSPLQAALSTLIFTVASACSAVVTTIGLTAGALVTYRWTGPDTALALALPLLVTGCGCGFVITANQTLTLQEITRANAGVASGVYETGQRLGTALGTALAGALFFGGLARTGGDFHTAAWLGLTSPEVLVGAAFLISLVDLLRPLRITAAVASEPPPRRPAHERQR
jgi:MFS family permease